MSASYYRQTFSHALQLFQRSFEVQIWNNIYVSKSFSVLANINCWFPQSFFLDSFGDCLVILREIRKTWRSHSFSAIKMDWDLIRHRIILFWKAYVLLILNKLITNHVTAGCFKWKLRSLFYIIPLLKIFRYISST